MFDPNDPIDVMARTIYGEARGCGNSAMWHVGSVIVNRANHPTWWGTGIAGVCLQPYQFSCWNHNDPNRAIILAATAADADFVTATQLATTAVSGQLIDMTGGADSYFADSMPNPPSWAASSTWLMDDGWHSFYRTISAMPPGVRPDIPNVSMHAVTP